MYVQRSSTLLTRKHSNRLIKPTPQHSNMVFGSRFKSTVGWMKIDATRDGYKQILEKFEEEYPTIAAQHEIDYDAEPVNIFCLDGGGMRG